MHESVGVYQLQLPRWGVLNARVAWDHQGVST